MAVLIEAISVVSKRSAIEATYPGGWDAFAANAPNATFCADNHLARVGFMDPSDVKAYIQELAEHGITYLEDDEATSLVVVDQQRGPSTPCAWVEFGHVDIGPEQRVAACRMVGDTEDMIITPDQWRHDGSLSQTFGFVPTGEESKSLRLLRHEEGQDVYLNEVTGEEVYVGRTDEH